MRRKSVPLNPSPMNLFINHMVLGDLREMLSRSQRHLANTSQITCDTCSQTKLTVLHMCDKFSNHSLHSMVFQQNDTNMTAHNVEMFHW